MLQQISVAGAKTYFDTKVSHHQHFYFEDTHELVDIPDTQLILQKRSDAPEGYQISRIDMVVRLRKQR
jgi:Fur family transcriptional regulator, iron response regulator